MKLRLHSNSVRIRLSQTDLARFAREGRIEDAVEFGGGTKLTYSLESSTSTKSPQAELHDGTIRILLPRAAAQAWAHNDQVGIEGTQDLGGDDRLTILVEKDFQCLHGEIDPDAFPR